MNCENCKYWKRKFSEVDLRKKSRISGICNRFPKNEYKYYSEWCGEFKSKGEISWSETIWSARLQSIFRYYGIQSFEQLTNYTPSDLLRMKRFGIGCLDEVTVELSKHGLSLINNQ